MAQLLDHVRLRQLWEDALAEDGFGRDVTSEIAVDPAATGTARIVAREEGIFAGAAVFGILHEACAPQLVPSVELGDGDRMNAGATIATLTGKLRLLLGLERTLLNFLQRLCGVATMTRRYVDAVAGTPAKICDTRKTIPGWRQLDKYAVRCGGGRNHRMGLHDAVLIKDNHIAGIQTSRLTGVLSEMLHEANRLQPPPGFIEVEVDTLDQLDQILSAAGVDMILLDNFTTEQMREAVARRDALGLKGKAQLEASGNITLDTVRAIAETGVERISVGALTHSVRALDIAMEIAAKP